MESSKLTTAFGCEGGEKNLSAALGNGDGVGEAPREAHEGKPPAETAVITAGDAS